MTTDARRGITVTYIEGAGRTALGLQERSFEYIRALDTGGAELADIARFIRERLCVKLPDDYNSAVLRAVSTVPSACRGAVRNEGRPGSSPHFLGRSTTTAPNRSESPSRARSHPPTGPLMQRACHFVQSIWSAACAT